MKIIDQTPLHDEGQKHRIRLLVGVVIALGILIAIGMTALIWVIMHRIVHRTSAGSVASTGFATPALPPPAPAQDILLHEPEGTRVTHVSRQTDTAFVMVLSGGGQGERVIVWDSARHIPLERLRLAP